MNDICGFVGPSTVSLEAPKNDTDLDYTNPGITCHCLGPPAPAS